ncbi:hypothetical protein GQ55_9G408900 [Panicum hallii var. hallii]|uniref:Uncharacterized protein n=1 Tax=Panicum hallii var. hallii TaxID=1504633 RepID=A0A2T7CA70_9POAL|nr:hypothetical protein GQ55_9G408900 [Panicum hallii var. hallii]
MWFCPELRWRSLQDIVDTRPWRPRAPARRGAGAVEFWSEATSRCEARQPPWPRPDHLISSNGTSTVAFTDEQFVAGVLLLLMSLFTQLQSHA